MYVYRGLRIVMFLAITTLLAFPVRSIEAQTSATCDGQNATITGAGHINGTSGQDVIVGSDDRDVIAGNGGDDIICSGGGNDFVHGGTGNDRIFAGAGDDTEIFGGSGDDALFGEEGNDRLEGESGDDQLGGGEGIDVLIGGSENDVLDGGPGDDHLDGGPGKDLVDGDTGNDTLLGGDGDDELLGDVGNDVLRGEDGNDILRGQDDDDFLHGGPGTDTLSGEGGGTRPGNDQLFGGSDDDVLFGEEGNDRLEGEGGDDQLTGGAGRDIFDGGPGAADICTIERGVDGAVKACETVFPPPPPPVRGCGLPAPDQVIIYQNRVRGGQCRVLGVGDFRNADQFQPVRNDSISSIDVGSAVRAVLYEHSDFRGQQAHFEGGFYYDPIGNVNDKTSSIEIFPMQGGPAATDYLGNYPSNRENFWSDEAQGLANDGANWFAVKNTRIFKVPLSTDLARSSSAGLVQTGIPAILKNIGYDHFGDPDQREGFLFVPIEDTDGKPKKKPRIGVFSTVDLKPLSSFELSDSLGASWLAIRPGDRTLWVSTSDLKADDQIREYTIDWTQLGASGQLILTFRRQVTLRDRDGVTLNLKSMQGGVFNPEGTLLYTSNGYIDTNGYVHVFAIDDATNSANLQARSENGYGFFNFETHPATDDEAEGLDWLDVRGRQIPGIPDGQLHLVMIDNDPFQDDLYLKHYAF